MFPSPTEICAEEMRRGYACNLEDGRRLRPDIAPTQRVGCRETDCFRQGLSVSARYFRFGQGDYDPGFDKSLKVCRLRPDEGTHLIAVTIGNSGEQIVGSARYVIQPDRSSCEFVIVVADKWSHHGIGHRLMNALLDHAKTQGLQTMVGRILGSNREMLQFVKGYGFEISDSAEGNWMKNARIDLHS